MAILKMSLMTLYSEIENICRQQILDSYPSDWSEDYITRKILFEYRKLYDNQSIQKFHDYSFFPSTTKQNHAVVVPIDIVESIIRDKDPDYLAQDKDRKKFPIDANSIYKFSVPLAYQILFRYFRGLDLD